MTSNGAAREEPSNRLIIDPASIETVYSWSTQKCDDNTIPDSPARAVRLGRDRILLMATHYNNRVLTGSDFASLKPDCRISAAGSESGNPAMFDDRYWVQAFLPPRDGRIVGLASHEFHGKRHPGSCSVDTKERVRCWYSSIVATEATAEELAFRMLPLERRIVAAPPLRYDSDRPTRYGFFTVSNVVRRDDFLYSLIYQEGIGGNRGNCLFRAPAANPLHWSALIPDGGWQAFPNPYENSQASAQVPNCMIVGKDVFSQFVSSLIYLKPMSTWVAVFSKRSRGRDGGIYYATSPDLQRWSKAVQLLHTVEPWADPRGCGTYFAYPSLIDHRSGSDLFDTAESDLRLYLTRFNYTNCVKGLDRDLVRYRVQIP